LWSLNSFCRELVCAFGREKLVVDPPSPKSGFGGQVAPFGASFDSGKNCCVVTPNVRRHCVAGKLQDKKSEISGKGEVSAETAAKPAGDSEAHS